MHRSDAEGRFGEAEPEGRSSVCARALTFGVSFCQEENVHFTYENASHPLSTGVRCTLTVKKWVNSRNDKSSVASLAKARPTRSVLSSRRLSHIRQ